MAQSTDQQQQQRWIVVPEQVEVEVRNVGSIDRVVNFNCPKVTVTPGCQPSLVVCQGVVDRAS
jgi:hypothetical protein